MVHVRLPSEDRTPGLGRRSLGVIEPFTNPDVMDDVRLLVSELLTNSVKHGGTARRDAIEMTVEVGSDSVRVNVRDAGRGFRYVRPDHPERDSGWGLLLVDQISDRWGVEPVADDGTSVWFEIAC
jgi:anti-sigma regulatory factor (Ser/Thr protein kinase)